MVTPSTICKWNRQLPAVVRCTCKLKISSVLPLFADVVLFRIGKVWEGAMEIFPSFDGPSRIYRKL